MPAPLASPVLQEVCWSPAPQDVTGFHGHPCYETDNCFVPTLPAGVAALWLPCAAVGCSIGPPPASPMGVQSRRVQARRDHATASGEDVGQSFSSITTSDIPLNPPFWLWPIKKNQPTDLQWGTPVFSPVKILCAWVEVIKPHTSLLRARGKDTELNKCCSLFSHEKLTQSEGGFSLSLKDVH